MSAFFKHLHTVNKHRYLVFIHCLKAGIPFQGLRHDLSKYSPTEFFTSVKHYQGTRSPNEGEREEYGYSKAWMHHKGRNKHHFEYWTDVDMKTKEYKYVKMPIKYLAEMICDRMAASKTYKGKDYTDSSAYDYFINGKAKVMMEKSNAEFIEEYLLLLKNQGEKVMFDKLKKALKESKKKVSH